MMRHATPTGIFLLTAVGVFAATAVFAKELTYTIQVGIPGFAKAGEQIIISPSTMKALVIALHNFAVYAGGTVAIVMGLWGGLKWVSAGGNPSHVESAKETIYAAILGLLLLLGSYVMLKTVNPEIVRPSELKLTSIRPVGTQQPLKMSTLGVAGSATGVAGSATGASSGSSTASGDANFSRVHPDLLNSLSFARTASGEICYNPLGGLQIDPWVISIPMNDGARRIPPCDALDAYTARTLTIDPTLINQQDPATSLRDLRNLLEETGQLNDVVLPFGPIEVIRRVEAGAPSSAGSVVLPAPSTTEPSSRPIDIPLPPLDDGAEFRL